MNGNSYSFQVVYYEYNQNDSGPVLVCRELGAAFVSVTLMTRTALDKASLSRLLRTLISPLLLSSSKASCGTDQ